MSIKLIFPTDIGMEKARTYAHHFLRSSAHGDGVALLTEVESQPDGSIDQVVDRTVMEMPPTISLEAAAEGFRNACPRVMVAQIVTELQTRSRMLRRFWLRRLPLLDNEATLSVSVLGLLEPWQDCGQGSLVYRRDTNLGAVAFVMPYTRVDLVTGAVEQVEIDRSAFEIQRVTPTEPPGQSAPLSRTGTTQTIIDSVLTMASFIGFGIGGPTGIAIAGLASVLEVIFNGFMSSGQVSLADQIDGLIKSDIEDDHVVTATASFNAYASWFKTNYDASWANQMDIPIPGDLNEGTEAFQVFLEELENALDPSQPLLQKISLMETADYQEPDVTFQIKALQAFLYGASLHLNLLKVRILLDGLPKNTLESPFLPKFVARAEEYIAHANKIVQDIESKISARLAQISGVQPGAMTICSVNLCNSTGGNYYTDSGADLSGLDELGNLTVGLPSDTVGFTADEPGGCCSDPVSHRDAAEAARARYVASVNDEARKKYVYTQSDKIKQTVEMWQSARDLYAKYLKATQQVAA